MIDISKYDTQEKRDAGMACAKAFADTDMLSQLEALPPIPEAMPTKPEEPAKEVKEAVAKLTMDEIKAKLQAIVDNKELDKAIKKTAEEMLVQLEELKAFEENANKFIKDNTPEVVVEPASVA